MKNNRVKYNKEKNILNKKIVKSIISFSLVMAMILTGVPTTWGNEKGKKDKIVKAASGETTRDDFAIFDNNGSEPVSLSGDNSTYNDTVNKAIVNTNARRLLTINADFSQNATDKKIVIKLREGIKIGTAPGMSGGSGNWNYQESNLPTDQLKEAIDNAIWSKDPNPDYITKYGAQSGTLTYYINSHIEKVSLDINLGYAYEALGFDVSHDFTDMVSVTTMETNNSTESIVEKGTLENLNIVGQVGISSRPIHPNNYLSQGDTWKQEEYVIIGYNDNNISSAGRTANGFLWKELKITYQVPKELQISDNIDDIYVSGYYPYTSSDVTVSLDTTSSSTYDYISYVFKATEAAPYKYNEGMYLYLNGQVSNNAQDKSYLIELSYDKSYALLANGQKLETYQYRQYATYIVNNNSGFTTTVYPSTSAYMRPEEWASSADQIFLEGFGLYNRTSKALNGYRIKVDTSDEHLGVKSFKFSTEIKDILIKTNENQNGYYIAYDDTKGIIVPEGLATDEYITSIEATMVDVPSGYPLLSGGNDYNPFSTGGNSSLSNHLSVYGKFRGQPGNYSGSLTIYKAKDIDTAKWNVADDWEIDNTLTQPVEVVEKPDGITYQSNGSNANIQSGGVAKTISASFNLVNNGLRTYSSGGGMLQSYEGFDIYVRQPKGITINPSTVYAKDLGTNKRYEVESQTPNVSADGSLYYVIHMNDAHLGQYKEVDGTLKIYSNLNVYADIRANATTVSQNLYSRDFFMGTVPGMETSNMGAPVVVQYRSDDFGILGTVETADERHFATPQVGAGLISVAGSPSVEITTAANRDNGSYETYDPTNPSSVISLNTKQKAHYQVTISNGTGKQLNPGQIIMIPIPKLNGEPGAEFIPSSVSNLDSTFTPDNYKFTWSAYLTKNVLDQLVDQGRSESDFTVMYSTNYTSDENSTDWQNYETLMTGVDTSDADAVKAKLAQVKTVKVVYNNAIPATTTVDTFNIELGMPQGDEAKVAQGNIDFYSSYIHYATPSVSGFKTSEPVALKLNTGIVSGNVYLDKTRNGIIDTAAGADKDDGKGQVAVKAYKTGTSELLDSTVTANDGSYSLINLSSDQAVDIKFTNPKTVTSPMGFVTDYASNHNTINDGNTWIVANITPNRAGSNSVNALLQEPYKVIFDTIGNTSGNASTGGTISNQYIYSGKKISSVISPTKLGQTFEGWFYKPTDIGDYGSSWTPWNVSSDIVDGTSIVSDNDSDGNTLTLRAGYSANSYTVSYVMNGGSYNGSTLIPPSNQSVLWTSTGLISTFAKTVTRAGYKLTGWKVTTGGNTTWNNTDKIITISSGVASDTDNTKVKFSDVASSDSIIGITLTAQWEKKEYTLNASDFSFGVTQQSSVDDTDLSLQDFIFYGNISLTDEDDNTISSLNNISIKEADKEALETAISQGKLGRYSVEITNTFNNTTKTIKVLLEDVGARNEDDKDFISGNGIILGRDEENISGKELLYRGAVNAKTSDGTVISRSDLSVDATDLASLNSALQDGSTDEVDVKVSTINGTVITIPVSIRQYGSGVFPTYSDDTLNGQISKGTIGGSDFVISNDTTLTEDLAKSMGLAIGRDLFANEYTSNELIVDGRQLQTINDDNKAKESGVYPLTFKTPEGEAAVTINVIMYNVVTPESNDGRLFANNFIYNLKEKALNPLNQDLAKELSKVNGANGDNVPFANEEITVDETSWNNLIAEYNANKTGIFKLTFNAPGDLSITINVTLAKDKVDVDNQGGGGKIPPKVIYKKKVVTKTITKNNIIYRTISKVKTGDYNNILLMIALFAAALSVTVVIVKKKRK
ncbi:MAG: hypothetical protein LBM02_08985 [Lachnospiraceae bacterium]|jgi:hypothetical protein|nr:hypothetical protein [Lachnospiraceae bacterium]